MAKDTVYGDSSRQGYSVWVRGADPKRAGVAGMRFGHMYNGVNVADELTAARATRR